MEGELKYYTRGYHPDYPVAFMSPAKFFMYQTTELSYDGSPRYSCNPNAEGTYWIVQMRKNKRYIEIPTMEDLEMLRDLNELGINITG